MKSKLNEVESLLLDDREYGVKIPRRLWPKSYIDNWGINNLYKCNLGPDWRLMYTLVAEDANIAVLELEILRHKEYDRLLGYRTT